MKRYLPVPLTAIVIASMAGFSQGQCPEDPRDNGICDTMYVEVFPPDTLFSGFVRVPIFVTHDVLDPYRDSLSGFIIPLCYTRSNPSKYCSLSYHWNNTSIYPFPDSLLEHSIFRHFVEGGDTIIHNWMMDQSERMPGLAWANRDLLLDDTSHFWFTTNRRLLHEQHFGPGRRILLATLTFSAEDTMTICLDSCFWPPEMRLWFITQRAAVSYGPRHNLPYCFSLSYPELGDVNADGTINIGDVVYLINYLYRASPYPVPAPVGDTNCDGVVDIGDVVFLINYLFKGGDPPDC